MDDRRIEFHKLLCGILGTNHVYYQAPEKSQMKYPAIIYNRERINNKHANNHVYYQKTAYKVTVIDPNPDSEIVQKISKMDLCKFENHYVSDNLNHDVYLIYY